MKKIIILASSIAAILVVTITILVVMFVDFDKPSRNATSKYDDELVESVGNFTAVTAGNILNKQENVCYSPASLYVALCVASELMTDDAGKEVLTSLKYDNLEHMENGYKELIERIIPPASRDVVVNIVNSIWIQEEAKNYDSEEFIDSCSKKIPMEIFVKEFDKKEVNEWISDKTNGLIKEAVEEADKILGLIKGYDIDLPVVFDYEYTAKDDDGRLWVAKDKKGMTDTQRTNVCLAFCETVEAAGYDAMALCPLDGILGVGSGNIVRSFLTKPGFKPRPLDGIYHVTGTQFSGDIKVTIHIFRRDVVFLHELYT